MTIYYHFITKTSYNTFQKIERVSQKNHIFLYQTEGLINFKHNLVSKTFLEKRINIDKDI